MESIQSQPKQGKELETVMDIEPHPKRVDASALTEDERQLASAMISVSLPLPFRLQ